ncbi:MAG: histone deacetylase [Luteolibacter sp.]
MWVRFGAKYFLVRALEVGDMRALQEFFYSHNEETIRMRYGYLRQWMSDEDALKLVAVDQARDPALGIFQKENGKVELRAIGRYYLDEVGKKAEIAFVVHEETRHIGMAGFLIASLAEIANQRGITEFWAHVLPDNRTMAGLFVAVGGREAKAVTDDERTFVIAVKDILQSRKKFLIEKKIDMKQCLPRKVGVHYDSCYERHDTGPNHPESADRYRVLKAALERLPPEFVRLPGRRAEVSEILRAHEYYYHDVVWRDVEEFADCLRTGDTAICEESYDVALEASGAVLYAVDAVMAGEVSSAFCAVRPPGHHATAERGMGFCLFNHIAIAARHLQEVHGLKRIAIIDWDVHHGNGTESIFLEDPSVLYVSLHEHGNYPYTASDAQRGEGAGEGATLNISLPEGSDGEAALQAWCEKVDAAVNAFEPEFILISAGFDSRIDDPIGGLRWSDETFAEMTRRSIALADRWCGGRIVSMLEGGYNPQGLADAAVAHVRALESEG